MFNKIFIFTLFLTLVTSPLLACGCECGSEEDYWENDAWGTEIYYP